MTIEEFGPRICIMGPSSTGKSTLAVAIGRATSLPVVHLDQYRFVPGVHWTERPDAEFGALHDEAVSTERWIIEGNYSKWMAPRIERATGFIFLDSSAGASLWRYLLRTWSGGERAGGLDGVRDRVSWTMIHWILGPGPRDGRRRHRELFEESSVPAVFLRGRMALRAFYREVGLTR